MKIRSWWIACLLSLSCSCLAQDHSDYWANDTSASSTYIIKWFTRTDTSSIRTTTWLYADTIGRVLAMDPCDYISFRSYPKTDTIEVDMVYANRTGHVKREQLNCIRWYIYHENAWQNMTNVKRTWYNKRWKQVYVSVILSMWEPGKFGRRLYFEE